MSGVNKVILVGNLGNDPDVRYTNSGSQVTQISVATSERWKDKQSGEQREKTEWHRVVFWNRLAEIASEYLHKGSKVYIEGKLETQKWDRDGQTHYTTQIVARELQMLDSRNSGGDGGDYQQPRQQQQSQPRQQPRQQQRQKAPQEPEDFEDDIPF